MIKIHGYHTDQFKCRIVTSSVVTHTFNTFHPTHQSYQYIIVVYTYMVGLNKFFFTNVFIN